MSHGDWLKAFRETSTLRSGNQRRRGRKLTPSLVPALQSLESRQFLSGNSVPQVVNLTFQTDAMTGISMLAGTIDYEGDAGCYRAAIDWNNDAVADVTEWPYSNTFQLMVTPPSGTTTAQIQVTAIDWMTYAEVDGFWTTFSLPTSVTGPGGTGGGTTGDPNTGTTGTGTTGTGSSGSGGTNNTGNGGTGTVNPPSSSTSSEPIDLGVFASLFPNPGVPLTADSMDDYLRDHPDDFDAALTALLQQTKADYNAAVTSLNATNAAAGQHIRQAEELSQSDYTASTHQAGIQWESVTAEIHTAFTTAIDSIATSFDAAEQQDEAVYTAQNAAAEAEQAAAFAQANQQYQASIAEIQSTYDALVAALTTSRQVVQDGIVVTHTAALTAADDAKTAALAANAAAFTAALNSAKSAYQTASDDAQAKRDAAHLVNAGVRSAAIQASLNTLATVIAANPGVTADPASVATDPVFQAIVDAADAAFAAAQDAAEDAFIDTANAAADTYEAAYNMAKALFDGATLQAENRRLLDLAAATAAHTAATDQAQNARTAAVAAADTDRQRDRTQADARYDADVALAENANGCGLRMPRRSTIATSPGRTSKSSSTRVNGRTIFSPISKTSGTATRTMSKVRQTATTDWPVNMWSTSKARPMRPIICISPLTRRPKI